jgi:hypothetical protein
MKAISVPFVFALCLAGGIVFVGATATFANSLYMPDAASIQSMIDRTRDFSGGSQATTATYSNIAGGIAADVIWSTGTSSSSGSTSPNEFIARIALSHRYPIGSDGDGGDFESFDGICWLMRSDIPLVVTPFMQVYGSFDFYLANDNTYLYGPLRPGDVAIPADGQYHPVTFDWNMADLGSVLGPVPTADRGNVYENGFIVYGPVLQQDSGETVHSTFSVIAGVPEPASIILACVGGLAVVVRRNRAHRKFR